MLRTRVIPALLLRDESLVKTVGFKDFTYVGDPANTVRIFNELEVDELLFLDISATPEKRKPNLIVLSDIANECFMPLGYGGGIASLDDAKQVFDVGFEKIALNSSALNRPELISEIARHCGSQALIVSIDVKTNWLGKHTVRTLGNQKDTGLDPVVWAQQAEQLGAGEILLTSIDREGSYAGFDIELISAVTGSVSIPVIAHGGAGKVEHIREAVKVASASAVALGSMVVFQKQSMGVLVNFPSTTELAETLT